jgi:hypothetical protein
MEYHSQNKRTLPSGEKSRVDFLIAHILLQFSLRLESDTAFASLTESFSMTAELEHQAEMTIRATPIPDKRPE